MKAVWEAATIDQVRSVNTRNISEHREHVFYNSSGLVKCTETSNKNTSKITKVNFLKMRISDKNVEFGEGDVFGF